VKGAGTPINAVQFLDRTDRSVGLLFWPYEVDISKYIIPATSLIELEVVMKPTGGELIIYSPGHEDKEARFSEADSFSTIPISGSILCIKALRGPFDFDLHVVAIRGVG
jgi:hypothetical protein